MSKKLIGSTGRKTHWLTANEADTDELFNLAVARGVADSLDHEIAKRTVWDEEDWQLSSERGKESLYGIPEKFEPAIYQAWNTGGFVAFDPLAEITDEQRREVGKAIALAYTTRPAYIEEIVAQVVYADKVKTLQDEHIDELTRTLAAYVDDVNAGGCPTATLAAHLRKIGDTGAEYAGTVETNERTQADLLLVWFNPDRPGLSSYPLLFARAIWHDKIRPAMEAGPPRPRIVLGNESGDKYLKVPKTMGAVAWGVAGMANIDVDGNKYAAAPGLMRYLPRAYAVLPIGKSPHQQTLGAALYDPDDSVSLVSRAVSDTQALLGTDAGKLTLLFMSTGGKFNKLSLRELVEEVTPDRRIRQRDYQRVSEALRDIRGLGLVLPDKTDVRLFDIRAPNDPTTTTPDQVIAWTYTQTFRDALISFDGSGSQVLRALNGEFLINYSALMRFNARQGVLMRHYLTAATVFNDSMGFGARAGYDPAAAPKFTREQWAIQANSLSQAAVDLIKEGRGTQSKSVQKSRDLKQSDKALDELESMGLIRIEGPAKARKILAPDEWQEAYRTFRTGGSRPELNK